MYNIKFIHNFIQGSGKHMVECSVGATDLPCLIFCYYVIVPSL